MKKLHQQIAIYIILISLSLTTSLMAQTNEEPDSLISDKGNLELLVDRVYLAFKAYRTGMYEFDKIESEIQSDSARAARSARADSLVKAGVLVNYSVLREKPIYPAVIKNGEHMRGIPDLNKIPADSVQSIEVMDNGTGITTIYGLSSKGIVIRLKE